MHRPVRFHPGPLTILVAIVLCLVATLAFGQTRALAPGAPRAAPATTSGLPAGSPVPSGLTSGSAPALGAGAPAPSGLTSGSAPALPPGAPAASGLTSGSTVAPATSPGGITGADTTATPAGGSTRGVVVLPADSGPATGTLGAATSVAPTRLQISGPLSALQIAQFFAQADGDGDGLLTRAEALRLPVVTMSFDDMDANRDGVVSRSEYEASLR
ncbi:MAG: hypothetical protein ACXWC2_02880 [Ramlibacter sp.]